MKRLFGSRGASKSVQSDKGSTEALDEPDATEEAKSTEEPKPQKTRIRKQSVGQASIEDLGQGDAPDASNGRRARSSRTKDKESDEKEDSRKVRIRKQKASTSKADPVQTVDSNEDDDNDDDDQPVTEFIKAPPPRPLPRRVQGSTSLFSPSESDDEQGDGDNRRGQSDDEVPEIKEVIQDTPSSKSKKGVKGKEKETSKKTVAKKPQRARPSDDADGAFQFVNIKDSQSLPKIESAKGGHFFSSVYNYSQPISTFRFRARLLKYPAFTDQQQWTDGEMAVVDERIFHWQEKIFSKSEAKRFQKLDHCLSEQERKYHDELAHSKKSVGKFLHSYVNDDLYSIKKKMKLLARRCPVPHTKSKEKSSLDTSIRSMNSDDSLDLEGGTGGDENVYSDDSIDFDEPVSSSTPVQGRKGKEKGASEIAKAEKRVRERKEKEMKDLERRSLKLKEELKKREKDEEKKRHEEDAKVMDKVKKLEAIESKEKELKAAYMKKYKYSKRPSMPLGARIRSVRLTPSPGKLDRKKKSYTVSRSSEISEDFQDEEDLGSGPASLDSKDDQKKPLPEHLKSSSKVGTEYEEYYGSRRKLSSMGVIVGTDVHGKLEERASHLKNAQTMHIMASIPYLPGRSREVVVCSIQNIPNQQVLIFKPAMGYRNIETKRNNVFRISCEICPSDEAVTQQRSLSDKKTKGYLDDDSIYGDLGFFETVPKNEFRLSVLGEIATANGFDSSPICIYYAVDIPKGWRNDSLQSNTEGVTHTCFTNHDGFAHFSHEFSFQLVFSMDFIDEPEPNRHFPTPVIALMAVSMNHPSPRIVYEGYGYVTVPMTPGCHFLKIRMWKPRPRTVVERMRATFLDISPSLQDMKLVYPTSSDNDDYSKANLIGLQTDPSGTVKLRLHVIHQSPSSNKEYESNLDLLEKMSSATILRSVQAVIQAFQRVRQKAETLKNQYD